MFHTRLGPSIIHISFSLDLPFFPAFCVLRITCLASDPPIKEGQDRDHTCSFVPAQTAPARQEKLYRRAAVGTAKSSQQFPQGRLADMKMVGISWKREEELKKKDAVQGTQNCGGGGVHGGVWRTGMGGSEARVQR